MSQPNSYSPGLNKTAVNNTSNSGMQFFNPNKDNPSNPMLYQQNTANNSSATNLNTFKTKGFAFKGSSTNDPKGATHGTSFMASKNSADELSSKQSSHAMNKTLTGPSSNSSNSGIFTQPHSNNNKSLNSDMIKSSIHDNNREREELTNSSSTKFKTFESPTRRAPRMSEPMENRTPNIDTKVEIKKEQGDTAPSFLKLR